MARARRRGSMPAIMAAVAVMATGLLWFYNNVSVLASIRHI
jgi:hypothetical protein